MMDGSAAVLFSGKDHLKSSGQKVEWRTDIYIYISCMLCGVLSVPSSYFLFQVQETICKQMVSFGLYILKVVRRSPISSFNPEVDQDDNSEVTTIPRSRCLKTRIHDQFHDSWFRIYGKQYSIFSHLVWLFFIYVYKWAFSQWFISVFTLQGELGWWRCLDLPQGLWSHAGSLWGVRLLQEMAGDVTVLGTEVLIESNWTKLTKPMVGWWESLVQDVHFDLFWNILCD